MAFGNLKWIEKKFKIVGETLENLENRIIELETINKERRGED